MMIFFQGGLWKPNPLFFNYPAGAAAAQVLVSPSAPPAYAGRRQLLSIEEVPDDYDEEMGGDGQGRMLNYPQRPAIGY